MGIKSSRDGCAEILRIDRPEKRNALSAALFEGLTERISALGEDHDVRGIVLTGSEEEFSTGIDLGEATAVLSPDEFAVNWRRWRGLTAAIEASPLPVVAAINGFCLTGGLEVALTCDYRVSGENGTFGITSAKIGSVAGIGGTQRLPRLVGASKAKRMLFTGEFVDAATALAWGLVDEVVPVEETVATAVAMVHEIGTRAPLSVSWHKQAVNAGLDMDLHSALEYERALCGRAFTTHDRMEGMTAFLESRPPNFTRG
jgi:enoyl-CoA hydratase/carnithine racemase